MPAYRVMTFATAEKFVPFMRALDVSETARSSRGFFAAWKRHGRDVWTRRDPKFGQLWSDRRDNFVARHLEQHKRNPTLRRFLALVAWAYTPYSSQETSAILRRLEADDASSASDLIRHLPFA